MGKKRKPWIPPPPLDSAILVAEDALVSGADVLITGGAHKRIHGLKGYILPSSEENSATVNVRLYQGHATLQSKIWCVDRSNVAVSGPGPPVEDDGLHPSLRWRLRPPPLTVFSVRFVLGWQSLATMVPMKPDKRPQQGTPGSGRQPVTRLWQGVRRISKEGALLPQPLASARGDPPCTFEAAERAPVAAAFGKEKPREVPDTISTKTKTSSLSQYGVAPGHRKHKRRDEQEEMVEVEIEDDERSTALMTGYPGRGSYALMIPDDRQVSRSHLDDTGRKPEQQGIEDMGNASGALERFTLYWAFFSLALFRWLEGVQHIRIATASWTADLLHVYQKPYNFHPKASQDAKKIRAEIWSVLEAQLQRIPKRHTLLLVGDFNCPLKSYPQAGPRTQAGSGTMPPDQARLQTIVEEHGLAHLNSWCRAAGPRLCMQKVLA
ncbi:hypothetical protein AK812_SmicGene28190 [Symbiodinium microadriaticum]|uniref:Endonuclease/exonuclease/phosphatase domain-containing protein n=1 Tax=Symbiodinium microadriaticum TaxID=2951 RepID=A0A1Q9D522_SYMMI|nr:hypothetical protein AK812_SmicGene28190 [Symbiodinium microadriaticum]